MDVDGDQHEPNTELEIDSSKMQDRRGADLSFHSLLTDNNNQKKIHGGTKSKISKDNNFAARLDDEESIVVVSTPRGK